MLVCYLGWDMSCFGKTVCVSGPNCFQGELQELRAGKGAQLPFCLPKGKLKEVCLLPASAKVRGRLFGSMFLCNGCESLGTASSSWTMERFCERWLSFYFRPRCRLMK